MLRPPALPARRAQMLRPPMQLSPTEALCPGWWGPGPGSLASHHDDCSPARASGAGRRCPWRPSGHCWECGSSTSGARFTLHWHHGLCAPVATGMPGNAGEGRQLEGTLHGGLAPLRVPAARTPGWKLPAEEGAGLGPQAAPSAVPTWCPSPLPAGLDAGVTPPPRTSGGMAAAASAVTLLRPASLGPSSSQVTSGLQLSPSARSMSRSQSPRLAVRQLPSFVQLAASLCASGSTAEGGRGPGDRPGLPRPP